MVSGNVVSVIWVTSSGYWVGVTKHYYNAYNEKTATKNVSNPCGQDCALWWPNITKCKHIYDDTGHQGWAYTQMRVGS